MTGRSYGEQLAPPGPWVIASEKLPADSKLVEVELYRGDGHDCDVVRGFFSAGSWFVKLKPEDLAFSQLPARHSVQSWREVRRVRNK